MDRRTALVKDPLYRRPNVAAGESVVVSPTRVSSQRPVRSAGDFLLRPSRLQLTALGGRARTPPAVSPVRRGDAVDSKLVQQLPSNASRRRTLDPLLDAAFREQHQRSVQAEAAAAEAAATGGGGPPAPRLAFGGAGLGAASASARFLSKLAGRGLPVLGGSAGGGGGGSGIAQGSPSATATAAAPSPAPVAAASLLPPPKPDLARAEVVSIGRASLENLMQRLEALEQRSTTGGSGGGGSQSGGGNSVAAAPSLQPTFAQQLKREMREQELRHQQQLLEQQQMQQRLQQQLLEQQQQLVLLSPLRGSGVGGGGENAAESPPHRKRDLDVARVRQKKRGKHREYGAHHHHRRPPHHHRHHHGHRQRGRHGDGGDDDDDGHRDDDGGRRHRSHHRRSSAGSSSSQSRSGSFSSGGSGFSSASDSGSCSDERGGGRRGGGRRRRDRRHYNGGGGGDGGKPGERGSGRRRRSPSKRGSGRSGDGGVDGRGTARSKSPAWHHAAELAARRKAASPQGIASAFVAGGVSLPGNGRAGGKPKEASGSGSAASAAPPTKEQQIAALDEQIQTEAQVLYVAEILIDEFLRFAILPEILIEAISATNVEALPAAEAEARAIFSELLDDVVQGLVHRLLAEQMDDMVQQHMLKRHVHTLKPPLQMVLEDLVADSVGELAPRIADLAMEEMIDEYFFEQRIKTWVESIVDERSAAIAVEVFNGETLDDLVDDDIVAVVVDALATEVATECLAEAQAEAHRNREEREFAAVVSSTERFVLRAMLQKLVQTVATRGEPLILRNETRLVLKRNMVQSLVGRVAQLEAPEDDLWENAAHRWFHNRINGGVAFHCMMHQALVKQLDHEEARIDACEAAHSVS